MRRGQLPPALPQTRIKVLKDQRETQSQLEKPALTPSFEELDERITDWRSNRATAIPSVGVFNSDSTFLNRPACGERLQTSLMVSAHYSGSDSESDSERVDNFENGLE